MTIIKIPDEILAEAVDLGDFIKMELPERPIIIDPWLRQSSLAMIYAERGTGKTFLGLSIALSITTGTPIGNWEVVTPVGVIYVDGEMAADEMQEHMKSMSTALPPLLAPFKFLSSDLLHQKNCPTVNLNYPAWRNSIKEALANQTEIRVLILDNLSCLTPGIEENDKEAWDSINQWLIELRFMGIAVIFLHHAGKSGKQRGTSGREDALDIVMNLLSPPGHKPADGAEFIVSFTKSRGVCGADISDFTFSISNDNNGNTIWQTNVPTSHQTYKEKIIALLGSGKKQAEIRAQIGCSKQLVSKHAKWAIKNGFLVEDKATKTSIFTDKGREKYGGYFADY